MSKFLLFEIDDGIATLTMNRPEKLNAFTSEMLTGLISALDECESRDDVRAVILTHVTKSRIWDDIQAFPKRAARFEKPLIAAVNGAAVGGGMDLALACDIRVAGESARFAETYAKIGLLPGGGGAYFLPRLVGKARALELLWTADFLDAASALEIGLVNHVYPDDELMASTMQLARRIAEMPPLSIQLIKRTVNQSLESDMATALDLVSSHIAIARAGHDHPEAIKAYREKRKGTYKGY